MIRLFLHSCAVQERDLWVSKLTHLVEYEPRRREKHERKAGKEDK